MIQILSEKILAELQRQLADKGSLLPAREIQLTVQAVLARLDLVTREEFDAQAAVLARTRSKLEALEQQLAKFED